MSKGTLFLLGASASAIVSYVVVSKARAQRAPQDERNVAARVTQQMFRLSGIMKLQTALGIPVSGLFDAFTQAKLRAFQTDAGLAVTGMPDYESLRRLHLDPVEVFHDRPPGERLGVDA